MRPTLASFVALFTFLLLPIVLRAEKIEMRAEFTALADTEHFKWGNPGGQVAALRILAFGQQDGAPAGTKTQKFGDIFIANTVATSRTGSQWVLESRGKDGKRTEIKYKLELTQNKNGISDVILFPATAPNPDNEYFISLREKPTLAGIVNKRFEITNAEKFTKTPISRKNLAELLEYVEGNKALTPNVSVKSGKDSTVAVKAYYGSMVFKGESKIRFQSILDVELSYRPKVKNQFINKINGEMDLLYDTAPWQLGDGWLHGLTEIGISTRLEADQRFDNVDETFGITSYTPLNGRVFQSIANFFCFTRNLEGNAPAALLNLSYDYVANLANDATTHTRSTNVTTDRARAHFYWSMKLAKDLDWTDFFVTRDFYDINLIIDCGVAYDRRNAAFLPEAELSLEIGPSDPHSKNVSFIVTYANGKTKARFENYNGILAGLKMPF